MKVLSIVFCMLFLSCSNQAKKPNQTDPKSQNLCRYSQYLRILKKGKGYHIEILHPDKQQENYQLQIDQAAGHIAALSATQIGMLSALHEEKRVAAVTDIRYVFSPKVKGRFRQNLVFELKNESNISIDVLMRAKTDYLIYSAFEGAFASEKQLKKIGITCIPDYDWREATALGRAEWILLFGVLCDRLPEALKLFKTIEQSYLKTIRTPQQHDALNMISGNVTGDFWYTPAGESFLAEIYKRAGLSYVYASTKGTGSLAYSMEKILKDGSGVQLWLNPGFPTKQAILNANPKAKYLTFFKTGKIFCYTHNPNKFWELSTLRPDWLVEDLSQIAHGKITNKLHFYQEVE